VNHIQADLVLGSRACPGLALDMLGFSFFTCLVLGLGELRGIMKTHHMQELHHRNQHGTVCTKNIHN
jgi:hypothetical protein